MITEDYCSYEVAKLLKEKGFPFMAQIGAMWINENENMVLRSQSAPITWEMAGYIPCVTHDLAMKWLRDKEIDITIMPIYPTKINPTKRYMWELGSKETHKRGIEDTYEEAVEAAILYYLKHTEKDLFDLK